MVWGRRGKAEDQQKGSRRPEWMISWSSLAKSQQHWQQELHISTTSCFRFSGAGSR